MSMTEREQKMIDAYLPNPRDKALGYGEYYILDDAGRVQKVYITDIGFDKEFNDVYGVRYCGSGKRFLRSGEYMNIYLADLYDNKKDCKYGTHMCCGFWEHLRELEEQEHE